MTARTMKLFHYYRSSASYRVRIALALKGLTHDAVAINLLTGEQRGPDYTTANPAQLVPMLVDGDLQLPQSLAILDYLEDCHPEPPLLPQDSKERARVRAFALSIACDIHPLNNLRVLKYLTGPLGLDEAKKDDWARHWISLGLASLEAALQAQAQRGPYCFGARPGLADCVLIPQLYNARRVGVDLQPYPRLVAVDAACQALAAFQSAHPDRYAPSPES